MEFAIWEILAQGGPFMAALAAAAIVISIVVKTRTKVEAKLEEGDKAHTEIRGDLKEMRETQTDMLGRIIRIETKLEADK